MPSVSSFNVYSNNNRPKTALEGKAKDKIFKTANNTDAPKKEKYASYADQLNYSYIEKE